MNDPPPATTQPQQAGYDLNAVAFYSLKELERLGACVNSIDAELRRLRVEMVALKTKWALIGALVASPATIGLLLYALKQYIAHSAK